jgi:tRNA threonylcarbamoyladenosine biosynthesis protein TsaE
MLQKKTHTPEETREFGRTLAKQLEPGSVVALTGPLGSGKTVLVQGICSEFGVEDAVSSPSYVIINEYPGIRQGLRIWIYHFDLYRLESTEEFVRLGYEEYFFGRGISIVEWAEKAQPFLPRKRCDVNLKILSETERQIDVRVS